MNHSKGLRVVIAALLVLALAIPVAINRAFAKNESDGAVGLNQAAGNVLQGTTGEYASIDANALSSHFVSFYIPDPETGTRQYGSPVSILSGTPVSKSGLSEDAPKTDAWPVGATNFIGWFTEVPKDTWSDKQWTDKYFDFSSLDSLSGDVVLYAGFSENYIVRYLDARGNTIQANLVSEGSTLPELDKALVNELKNGSSEADNGSNTDSNANEFLDDDWGSASGPDANWDAYNEDTYSDDAYSDAYNNNYNDTYNNEYSDDSGANYGDSYEAYSEAEANEWDVYAYGDDENSDWAAYSEGGEQNGEQNDEQNGDASFASDSSDFASGAYGESDGANSNLDLNADITQATILEGWYLDPDLTVPAAEGMLVKANITLYPASYYLGSGAADAIDGVNSADPDASSNQLNADGQAVGQDGNASLNQQADPKEFTEDGVDSIKLPSIGQTAGDFAPTSAMIKALDNMLAAFAKINPFNAGRLSEDDITYNVELSYKGPSDATFSPIPDSGFTFGNSQSAGTYRIDVDWQVGPDADVKAGSSLLIPITFSGSNVTFSSDGTYKFYANGVEMGTVTIKHADANGNPTDASIITVPGSDYVLVVEFSRDIDENNISGSLFLEFAFYPTTGTGEDGFKWEVPGTTITGEAQPPRSPVVDTSWQPNRDISKNGSLDSNGNYIYDLVQLNEKHFDFSSYDSIMLEDNMGEGLMPSQYYVRAGVDGPADTASVVPVNKAKGIYGSTLDAADGSPAYLKLYYLDWRKAYTILYDVQQGRHLGSLAGYWVIPKVDDMQDFDQAYPTNLRGAVWTLLSCAIGDDAASMAQGRQILGADGSFAYLNDNPTKYDGKQFNTYTDVLDYFLTPVAPSDLNGISMREDGFSIDIKGTSVGSRNLVLSYVTAIVDPSLPSYHNTVSLEWPDNFWETGYNITPAGGGQMQGDVNKVTLRKVDANGHPLKGSVFNVSLYRSGDFNIDNYTPIGDPVANKSWDLYLDGDDAMAISDWLGRYSAIDYIVITEKQAPDGYKQLEHPIVLQIDPSLGYALVNSAPTAADWYSVTTQNGAIIVSVVNRPSVEPVIACEVDKDTIKRTSAAYVSLPGKEGFNNVGIEQYKYDIDFRSLSNIDADEYIVDDPLEAVAEGKIRLDMLVTPAVWGDIDGVFAVYYKTNLGAASTAATVGESTQVSPRESYGIDGWKRWAYFNDSASASYLSEGVIPRHSLELPAGMTAGEYITAVRFEYGGVRIGFTSRNTYKLSLNRDYRYSNGADAYYDGSIAPAWQLNSSGIANPGSLVQKGASADWRVGTDRGDYSQAAMAATGLAPASYLVHAIVPMQSEDIVSSAVSRIAKDDMRDADQDAVLTREIVTFETSPDIPDVAQIVNEDSFINNADEQGVKIIGGTVYTPEGPGRIAPLVPTGDFISLLAIVFAIMLAMLGVLLLFARQFALRPVAVGKRYAAKRLLQNKEQVGKHTRVYDATAASSASGVAGAVSASGVANMPNASRASGAANMTNSYSRSAFPRRHSGEQASFSTPHYMLRRVLLVLLAAVIAFAATMPISYLAYAAPGDEENVVVEYRYASTDPRPDVPLTLVRFGRDYRLLSASEPVLESTLPQTRTYVYHVSGALTPEQKADIEGLGDITFTPVDVVVEREVDKDMYYNNLPTNDVEEVPNPQTAPFEVTDAITGTTFKPLTIAGCKFTENPRDAFGLPTGYTAHVVYRGIESFSQLGYYVASANFTATVQEGTTDIYVIVAVYEPVDSGDSNLGGDDDTNAGATTPVTSGPTTGAGTGQGTTTPATPDNETDGADGAGAGNSQTTISDPSTPLNNLLDLTVRQMLLPIVAGLAVMILGFLMLFILTRQNKRKHDTVSRFDAAHFGTNLQTQNDT
ncbi:MAG: hypothetical protein LBG97_04825 [Coriobacteriales bacterium]|nr:hypothetical protein [Coriobacteriales bacterium]